MSEHLLIGIGAAAHLDCDLALDLDDLSPANHGAFQLQVEVEDGVVVAADPRIGLLHRSAEKLFEARDYRQIMMLANRHDWLSAFSGELSVALAVEAALGLEPPPLANWSRTLLAELTRVTASLLLLGTAGGGSPMREQLIDLQERATGGRVHPMITRIGGLAAPLAGDWLDDLAARLPDLRSETSRMAEQAQERLAPFAGTARLDHETAMAFGASGAVGRASGVDLDVRRDDPYCAYGELVDRLTPPLETAGDVPARYRVLAAQIDLALDLIEACMPQVRSLAGTAHDVPLPKSVRAPEGTTYRQIESPLGASGVLLVSVGERTPWRLKLRTPSFAHLQAMGPALVGTPLAALAVAVPSFFFVIGDADR